MKEGSKKESQKISETSFDATELLLESNKILEETNSFARLSNFDVSSVQSSDKLKLQKNEKDELIKKKTQNLEKSFEVNDNEARLSCFDFNEDDIQEPNVSSSKKIPRNLKSKNISTKNDDNLNAVDRIGRKISTENSKILQVCTLDKKRSELSENDSSLDEPDLSLRNNKGRICESLNDSFAKFNNKKSDFFPNEASASFEIAKYFESDKKANDISDTEKFQKTKKMKKLSLVENENKDSIEEDSKIVAEEILVIEKQFKQNDDPNQNFFPKDQECERDQTNFQNSHSLSAIQSNSMVDSFFQQESFSQNSQRNKDGKVFCITNTDINPRKRQLQLETNQSIAKELNSPSNENWQTLQHSKMKNQCSSQKFSDSQSEYCRTAKKQKLDNESDPGLDLQSLDLLRSDENFEDIKQSKDSNMSQKVYIEHENSKNQSTSSNCAKINESKILNDTEDYSLKNSPNQSTCHNFKDQLIMESNEIGKNYNDTSKSMFTNSFLLSQIQKTENICNENLKSSSLVRESVFIEEIFLNAESNCSIDSKKADMKALVSETQTFKTCNDIHTNNEIISPERNCMNLEVEKSSQKFEKIATMKNSEKKKGEIFEKCKNESMSTNQLNMTPEKLFEKIEKNVTHSEKKNLIETEIFNPIIKNVPDGLKPTDSQSAFEKNFVGPGFENFVRINPEGKAIERSNKFEINFPSRSDEIFEKECIVPERSNKTEEIVSKSNILNGPNEIFSGSNCTSVMKKREKPRIIKNVTLKEPMILKKKMSSKACRKFKPIADNNFRFQKSKNFLKIKNMKIDEEKEIYEKSSAMVDKKTVVFEKSLSEISNEKSAVETSTKSCFKTKKISSAVCENDILTKGYSSSEDLLNLTDMKLDINSMPLILSKELLTPESIEKMPVVISSTLPLTDMLDSKTGLTTLTAKTAHQISRKNESNYMTDNKKKLTDPPTILKNKSKGKPMITSIKTIVPPLHSSLFKGAFKINPQTLKTLDKRNKNFGNYVIVHASGPKSLHSRHEMKNKISTNTPITSDAQIVQQDGKVVIITPSQNSSLKSENKQGLFHTHVAKPVSPIVMNTSTSQKFQQFNLTSTISSIKNTKNSLKTVPSDKLVKFYENESLFHDPISKPHSSNQFNKKKEFNYPVTDSIQYLVTSEKPITNSENNTLCQSHTKNIVKTGILSLKKADQSMLIKAMPRSVSKTIISSQGIVTKTPVLTPITGSQVKALAAKNINVKKMSLQNKTLTCKKVEERLSKQKNEKTINLTHANNEVKQGPSNHMKSIQNISLEKEEVSKSSVNPIKQTSLTSEQVTESQTDSSIKKNQEKEFIITEAKLKFQKSLLNPKRKNSTTLISYPNKTSSEKKKMDSISADSHLLKKFSNIMETEHYEEFLNEKQSPKKETKLFENLCNKEKILNLSTTSLEFDETQDQTLKSVPKSSAESPLLALPTTHSDGNSTYILVSVDEKGLLIPLDNSTLITCEGISQNIHEDRICHSNSSTATDKNNVKNVVLEVGNGTLHDVQSKMETNIVITQDDKISNDLDSTKVQIRKSNPDILAVALADTDFHHESSTIENSEVNSVSNFSHTSLINQTILQSTIIPTSEPITSASVLETSSTLNQPIMTPLEVPSTLALQSKLISSSSRIAVAKPEELPNILSEPHFELITESTSRPLITCSTSSSENKKEEKVQMTLSMPIIDDGFYRNIDLDASKELFDCTKTEDTKRHSMKLFEESDFNNCLQEQEKIEVTNNVAVKVEQKNLNEIENRTCTKSKDKTSIEEKESLITNKNKEKSSEKIIYSSKLDSKISNEKKGSKEIESFETSDSSLINKDYLDSKPAIESIQFNLEVPFLVKNQENEKCKSLIKINESSCDKFMKTEKFDIQNKSSSNNSQNVLEKSFCFVIEKSKEFSESLKPKNPVSLHDMTLTSPFVTELKTDSLNDKTSQSFEKLNYNVNADKDLTETNAVSQISETNEQKLLLAKSSIKTSDPDFSDISCEMKESDFIDEPNFNLLTKHENNDLAESNDIEIDNICMSSVSLNHSVFCEDETVISSYVPETPENQERDQDQESAISTSSYEIPPCEELNFNNSSPVDRVIDSTSLHNNSILEISTHSFGLSTECNSVSMNLVQTSCYENQTSDNHSVSLSHEILNSIKKSDVIESQRDLIKTTNSTLEANPQKFITTCCNFNSTDQINLYSQQSENISNYFKSTASHKTSTVRGHEKRTEQEISAFYKRNITPENDQNFVHGFSNYAEDGETSSGYYDSCFKKVITQTSEQNCYIVGEFIESKESIQDIKNSEHSESNPANFENMTESVPLSIDYEEKSSTSLITDDTNLNKPHSDNYTIPTNFMN